MARTKKEPEQTGQPKNGADLFLSSFFGLLFLLLGISGAVVSAESVLQDESLVGVVIGIVLGLGIASAGAGFSAFGFVEVVGILGSGYRNVLFGRNDPFTLKQRLTYIGYGCAYLVILGGLGAWRFRSGTEAGEPHYAFQGIILSTLGGFVGLALSLPYLWPGFFGKPSGASLPVTWNDQGPRPSRNELVFSRPGQFIFLALMGLILSIGVIEYVHIKRAQEGLIPLTMGQSIRGRLHTSGFEGYPSEAELHLPPGLEGTHSIIYVEVSPCPMELRDDKNTLNEVKRIPKKVDAQGDTISYARWQFEAVPERRYRLKMMRPFKSCWYSVRLVQGGRP